MGKKKIINWEWYTPIPKINSKGKVQSIYPIIRYGEWWEVGVNEAVLVHTSHSEEMRRMGFVKCKGPKVYKTQRDAIKSSRDIRSTVTE